MKQLVLTTHTGINLNFPISDLVEFVRIHAEYTPAYSLNLAQQLGLIFAPSQGDGGFLILGLDDEDHLIGLVAMHGAAATQSGQHRLITLVVHEDERGQGYGYHLMRSAKMLSRERILLSIDPIEPVAAFFHKLGFEATEGRLSLDLTT